MKEALKIINECVLYEIERKERHIKLDNIRKTLYSKSESGYISTSLFYLIDEISVMIFDKTNYEVGDSFEIFQSNKYQENEKVVKLYEFCNSILNVLVNSKKFCIFCSIILLKFS